MTATAYIQSLNNRITYAREFERAMETVHLLLAPTLPVTAPSMDEADVKIGRSRENVRLAMLRLTRPGNLARLPAISIPCGFFKWASGRLAADRAVLR